MDIKYEIKHVHKRYIAYKNGEEIGRTLIRSDAQKLIEEDKLKRKQFRVVWLAKNSDIAQFIELEAKDENQAKIKVQQLYINDLDQILKVEQI